MEKYDHIQIERQEVVPTYRGRSNPTAPRPPMRSNVQHGQKLHSELLRASESILAARRDIGIETDSLMVLEISSEALPNEILELILGRFKLYLVEETPIAGSGIETVIQRLAAVENLLCGKGNEHRNGGSGKASLNFDTVETERQGRYKTVLLLEVQPHKLTVIFLRHACRAEKVVIQLLLAVLEVHHKEGQKKHSLVSALQITEDILCLACVCGKVGGDDIHVEPFTDRLFLCVDLHTVKIGNLSLDGLDRLVLVHTADMEADENITVGIQKLGEQSVVHLGRADL